MDHRMAKSKSLSSLTSEDIPCHGLLKIRSYNYGKFRRMSDSSVEVFIMNDSASEGWCDDKVVQDSGLGDHLLSDGDVVEVLERKFDKLQELFQEQCQLLSSIKQQMQTALRSQRIVDDSHHTESPTFSESLPDASFTCEDELQNVRARSLLDAIERKQASCLDRVVKDALTDLLNSDDLKQQLVSATVSLLQDKMAATLSRDMAAVYLPLLQRFNRKLLRATTRTLEDAFAELEDNSNMCRFANSAARALRRALGVHRARVEGATAAAATRRAALHDTINIVLKSELSRWRSGLLCVPPALAASATPTPPAADDALASPPQPPNPDTSIIDQLMMSAEINKQIQDGDIAGSLTRALCANDLSLVVAACRGIDPERVFRPCTLPANILLSLVQQLATDMVHDTQLKCRYLEESLIALGSSDMAPVRAHLSGVCGDVRAHLTHFLQRFPAHAAATRLNLILMAVDALMK